MHWLFASVALFVAAGTAVDLASLAEGSRPAAQVRHFTLYVRDGWLPLPDGGQIYVWGFTDDPNGPPQVPGPAIVVNEGDTVEVTLVNDRDPTASPRLPLGEGHTIHLHGLDVPTEHDGVPETHAAGLVRQGGSFTYRFKATHAGTYWYHCHQNNVEHQQMGMYGPLVVKAANGAATAYTGGPAYDREHTLVLAEMGAEGHEQARRAAQEGADPYNWLGYTPSYFFVNDRVHTDGANVWETLAARPGERVLVRVINAGYIAHAVHAHGQPFRVVATDGRPWPQGPTTDTIWLGPGERYDLLLVADATGAVALHNHVDQAYAPAPAMASPTEPRPASGDRHRFTLYVREGWRTMPDGARIYVHGFTDDPDGLARVPGPALVASEGDLVEIALVDDRGLIGSGAAIEIHGLDAPLVQAGESQTYRFVASRSGSFFYSTRADSSEGQPVDPSRRMGLYGALVVKPTPDAKTSYSGSLPFDQEYTMVLSEMDAAGHEQTRRAVQEGRPRHDWSRYAPSYFLINGLAYPDTEADAASMVHAAPGERILIRAINAGSIPHAMHLHGYHFDLVARGGRPWPGGPSKDTVLIAPGETYDLLFVADQPGLFPFHDHFETANTNNGLWLGGMHTMVATGVAHHPPAAASVAAPGHAHHVASASAPAAPPAGSAAMVFVRDNFYAPNQVTVPVGATVRWEHQGQVDHTISSLLGYFDSDVLAGGDAFAHTFTAPGRYDYFCRFHITNRGTIIVE